MNTGGKSVTYMIYFLRLFKVVLKLISKGTCMAIKIMFLCSTHKRCHGCRLFWLFEKVARDFLISHSQNIPMHRQRYYKNPFSALGRKNNALKILKIIACHWLYVLYDWNFRCCTMKMEVLKVLQQMMSEFIKMALLRWTIK